MCAVRKGQLFEMMIRVAELEQLCINEVNFMSKQSLDFWHERLGHQNKRHVTTFFKECGIKVDHDDKFCEACVQGKQHRSSFQSRQQRTT